MTWAFCSMWRDCVTFGFRPTYRIPYFTSTFKCWAGLWVVVLLLLRIVNDEKAACSMENSRRRMRRCPPRTASLGQNLQSLRFAKVPTIYGIVPGFHNVWKVFLIIRMRISTKLNVTARPWRTSSGFRKALYQRLATTTPISGTFCHVRKRISRMMCLKKKYVSFAISSRFLAGCAVSLMCVCEHIFSRRLWPFHYETLYTCAFDSKQQLKFCYGFQFHAVRL